MSYVSAEALEKYSNVHSESALGQNYIDAAENIVNAYLGYSPTLHSYSRLLDGTGTNELQLNAKPVAAIISIDINGETVPPSELRYTGDSEFIYYDNGFPSGQKNIRAEYNAGWGITPDNDEANGEYLPGIIRLTVLRIAALLQTESDNNIGVTSKSFAESGTRTFVNTVNFDKYLVQISSYKLLVI
jgi:hypothetical protein